MRISSPGICGPRITRKFLSRARVSDGSAARAAMLVQMRMRSAVKERRDFIGNTSEGAALRGSVLECGAAAPLSEDTSQSARAPRWRRTGQAERRPLGELAHSKTQAKKEHVCARKIEK